MSQLSSLPTEELHDLCRLESSRRGEAKAGASTCFELFRRAVDEGDQAAWAAIHAQYDRLVRTWLGSPYRADGSIVNAVFARFWLAHRGDQPFADRYTGMGEVMAYLKTCAVNTRIDVWRQRKRRERLREALTSALKVQSQVSYGERLADGERWAAARALVGERLRDDQERAVVELHYGQDLPPREVFRARPDLFDSPRAVSRAKERLLKRLARDETLRRWWNREMKSRFGGKPATGDV